MEALELLEALACGGEHNRPPAQRLHRQRRAAARIAVELAHHDAIEVDRVREALRDVDGILAGHRVDDEQHMVRLERLAHAPQLVHQRLIDVQAPARIDDQHVAALAARARERPLGDLHRVVVGAPLVRLRARALAEDHELLDRRRALGVARRERDRRGALLAQEPRELRARGRLARALQARHQDHRRRMRSELELARGAPHQLRQPLRDDLHDLLAGVQAPGDLRVAAALLERRHEILHYLEVHVRLEQREADLAHRAVDVLLAQAPAAAYPGEGSLQFFGKRIEHLVLPRSCKGAGRAKRGS